MMQLGIQQSIDDRVRFTSKSRKPQNMKLQIRREYYTVRESAKVSLITGILIYMLYGPTQMERQDTSFQIFLF